MNLWVQIFAEVSPRFHFLVIFLSCFSIHSTAQDPNERLGVVIDSQTGQALAGANILASDNKTITDSRGYFRLATTADSVTISHIGFQPGKFYLIPTTPKSSIRPRYYLVPKTESLEEVVISSGKFEQRIEEVTVSLDVLKPPIIEDKNLVEMESLLQQAPGVNVTEGQANIRGGSGWTYGAGTRVQTLVDNMPLISGDANQVQWNLVPIYSVDRVEVLKGASSVLYGSAALNGVINVLTPGMPVKTGFSANLFSGFYAAPSRQELKWWDNPQFSSGINFSLQKPLRENTGLLLSGGAIRENGFRYLEDENRGRLFGKYFWKGRGSLRGLDASLAAHGMYNDQGNALLWESDSLGYIPADSNITRAYGWDFYVDPVISYRHQHFRHQVQTRYLKVNNNVFNNTQDYTNSSDLYFGQYTLQYFSPQITYTFGASSSYSESQSVIFAGSHSTTNNALFLQLDGKFWDKLNLTAGLRHEAYRLDSRSFARPVFRAGANFKLREGTNLRASFGQAFRFPSMAEAFTATQVGIVVIYPNADLKAENGHTYELGLKKIFRSSQVRGYIDVAAFRMQYFDMIEYNAAQWGPQSAPLFGFGFSPVNIGNTSITGIELSTALEGKLGSTDYRLLGGYTYSLPVISDPDEAYATNRTGRDLTYRQTSSDTATNILKYRYRHLAKLDAQISWRNWEFGASFRYNSFMENIDNIFLIPLVTEGVDEARQRLSSGDFVVDARIEYRFSRNWRADFIVNNLFNREVMIRPAYLGPPTQWMLRLNYRLR